MKSFYARSIILVWFLVGFSAFVSAQENCRPILQTSDDLLNLQLGMTIEEVSNKFGKDLKIKTKSDGDYRFFQNYISRKPPKNLSGVRALYLRFFEKKLYQIEIFYLENKYPAELKGFAEIISNHLILPVSDWHFAHRQAVLKCAERSLVADYQLNPRIELTNETVRLKVAEAEKTEKVKAKSKN